MKKRYLIYFIAIVLSLAFALLCMFRKEDVSKENTLSEQKLNDKKRNSPKKRSLRPIYDRQSDTGITLDMQMDDLDKLLTEWNKDYIIEDLKSAHDKFRKLCQVAPEVAWNWLNRQKLDNNFFAVYISELAALQGIDEAVLFAEKEEKNPLFLPKNQDKESMREKAFFGIGSKVELFEEGKQYFINTQDPSNIDSFLYAVSGWSVDNAVEMMYELSNNGINIEFNNYMNFGTFVDKNPSGMAQWSIKHQPDQLSEILDTWGRTDNKEALKWLIAQPNSPTNDALMQDLINNRFENPDEALNIINQ